MSTDKELTLKRRDRLLKEIQQVNDVLSRVRSVIIFLAAMQLMVVFFSLIYLRIDSFFSDLVLVIASVFVILNAVISALLLYIFDERCREGVEGTNELADMSQAYGDTFLKEGHKENLRKFARVEKLPFSLSAGTYLGFHLMLIIFIFVGQFTIDIFEPNRF